MRSLTWLGLALVVAVILGFALMRGQGGDQPVKPPNWPDLSVLTNYPNPHGDTCDQDGETASGNTPRGDKLEENQLKNRFLPPSRYTAYSVDDMLKLPTGDDSVLDNTGAALTGYVLDVKPGGTEGESCNCDAKRSNEVDAHIEVIADPDHVGSQGRGVVIVEVTERSRRLATAGLLTTSFGNDWSTTELKNRLTGHWVKFLGWLMFDPDHEKEAWSVDSDDSEGRRNWRGTPWEVHPVLGIEILPGKASNIP